MQFSRTAKIQELKRTSKPKNRTNGTKELNFLNDLRALRNKIRGIEANGTRKFTRKFDKFFVSQVPWGTFSVPKKQERTLKRHLVQYFFS